MLAINSNIFALRDAYSWFAQVKFITNSFFTSKSCIFCSLNTPSVFHMYVGESVFKANVQRSETQDAEPVLESKGKLLCMGGICEQPDDDVLSHHSLRN